MFFTFFQKRKKSHKLKQLPIAEIQPCSHHPRRFYDADGLEELIGSIKKYGVLQPITVRRKGNGYEVIAGERRIRAAKMAALTHVPCLIVTMKESDAMMAAIVENSQKETLSGFDIANAYTWLIMEKGLSRQEIATQLGIPQTAIACKLKLMRLSCKVRDLMSDYGLCEEYADVLLKLPDEESMVSAIYIIIDKGLGVLQARELVEKLCHGTVLAQKQKQGRAPADDRIFSNTVRRAVDMMNKAGMQATSIKNEYDNHIEYVISISKPEINMTISS